MDRRRGWESTGNLADAIANEPIDVDNLGTIYFLVPKITVGQKDRKFHAICPARL